MKKIIMLLLAGLLVFNCTACNKKEDSSAKSKDVSYSEEGVFPIVTEDEEVELTVWAILSSDIEDYSTNLQSKWYEEYTGVKINWINVPAQGWADQFQLSVMNGELPDIYLYDFAVGEVRACVEYDAIIPLNDLIEEHCPNIRKYIEENEDVKKTITNKEGDIYTLFSKCYNMSAYKQKLWVNTEWLEAYEKVTGNGMPETTEEFKQMLVYFKNNDMNGNGDKTDEIPYLGVNGLDGMYNLFNSFVTSNSSYGGYGCYTDDNGEIEFAYNKDAFRDALSYANELYSLGLISDQSFTLDSSDRYLHTSGEKGTTKVGVTTAVTADQLVQLTGEDNWMDYSDYTVIPPLEGPDGHRTFVTDGEYTIALKNAITTKCQYPEIAAKWLDYWFSEEGRLWSVNGGLEGVDWEYKNGTTIEGTGDVVTPIKEVEGNYCWAGQGVSYMLKADDFLHMDASKIGKNNVLSTYKSNLAYHDYKVETCWPAIVWTDGSQEINDMSAECSELIKLIKDHVTVSYTDFIMGEKDIHNDDEWNAYVTELDNIGVERYLELVEKYISLAE